MNGTLSNVLIFTTGAIVGSVVTWKLIENKYRRIAREEIDSVKERYSTRNNHYNGPQDANEEASIESVDISSGTTSQDDYTRLAQKYSAHTSIGQEEPKEDSPYVIPPEEFGEKDDYELKTLIYYADGVLADEAEEPVSSINDIVGRDALTSFGVYEDDAVHVRNDELRTDFEILADTRNYVDVVNNGPQLTEAE